MRFFSAMTEKQLRFAQHYYNNPSFGTWYEWFAWYPVQVVTYHEIDLSTIGVDTFHLKVYNWVWLKKVSKRKVIDSLDRPGLEGLHKKVYYEYTTLMELLKNGY